MNNGEPAFPTRPTEYHGMSLRDYFAGQALMGMMASIDQFNCPAEEKVTPESFIASLCYTLADAMLAERNKTDEP